jgi:hypothetical protein
MDLVSAVQLYGSPSQVGQYGAFEVGLPILFKRNLPTSLVASGLGLQFPGGFYNADNAIEVKARALLTAAVSGGNYSDLSGGIDAETIAYGAAYKLVADKDIARITQEDISHSDRQVQPQARLRSAAYYEGEYRMRLHKWNQQLLETSAPMRTWG